VLGQLRNDQPVWIASWNLTEDGTYRNNNNAVLIASTALAENYTAEFEEMFTGSSQGVGDGCPRRYKPT
jgi:hypothetical protein